MQPDGTTPRGLLSIARNEMDVKERDQQALTFERVLAVQPVNCCSPRLMTGLLYHPAQLTTRHNCYYQKRN